MEINEVFYNQWGTYRFLKIFHAKWNYIKIQKIIFVICNNVNVIFTKKKYYKNAAISFHKSNYVYEFPRA